MKVRFENFFTKKCEVCGKPAKWKCNKQDNVNHYWSPDVNHYFSPICVFHYYCDKCVKEK